VTICAATFVCLGVRVAGGSQAGAADRQVTRTIHVLLPKPMRSIVALISLGDALPVITFAVLLCALSVVLGNHRAARLAIAGPLLTGIVTTGVKPLVGRTIRDHLAYPSGHTGAWTSLGLVAAIILIGVLSTGPMASALLLASGALGAGGLMALALITYYAHYPSDTVGGFCAAIVCVLGCVVLIERIAATAPRCQSRGH